MSGLSGLPKNGNYEHHIYTLLSCEEIYSKA